MNTLELIDYLSSSAIMVLSFFFSVRCLFAHDLRLEVWRSPVKRWVYVDRVTFKRLINSLGVLCLAVFLITAYSQFLAAIH